MNASQGKAIAVNLNQQDNPYSIREEHTEQLIETEASRANLFSKQSDPRQLEPVRRDSQETIKIEGEILRGEDLENSQELIVDPVE